MKRTAFITLFALLFVSIIGNVPITSAQVPEWHINAGGAAYTAINGDIFVADKAYTAGDFGYAGNKRDFSFANAIANTDDDPIYQDLASNRNFSYLFDIPNGDYDVTLYFMEPWQDAVGERVFDVSLEGVVALNDYDIYAVAGARYTAVTETLPVTINDGQLNIDFDFVSRYAMVAGISVVSSTPATPEPDIAVLPTNLDFGDVENGTNSDLTVTVTNDGTADLSISSLTTTDAAFAVISPTVPLSVTVGASEIVTIRFSPTAAAAYSGNLEIASNDPDEALVTVTLSGNGVEPPPNEPDISVSPAAVDFGQVTTGGSGDQIVTISNTGLQMLTVSDLSTDNGVFTIVTPAAPFDVAASASQDVTVRFSPTIDGVQNGNLTITSNDPDEGTVIVSLTGAGVSTPAVAYHINSGGPDYTDLAGTLFVADKAYVAGDFGHSGNIRDFSFSNAIANTDDDALYQDITANIAFSYLFDLPNGDYDVTLYFMEPWQSAAGERLFDVTVEGGLVLDDYDIFAASGGRYTAVTETIPVTVNDGQLNIDFSRVSRYAMVSAISVVSAGGVTPPADQDISVSPPAVDFGQVTIGNTADQIVTVSNVGGQLLTVSDLTTSNGVFTIVSPPTPFDVGVSASQAVTVRFTPAAELVENGDLTITSNDPDEGIVTVSLTGEGATTTPPGTNYVNVTTSAGLTHSHVINTGICQPTNNPPIGNGAAWADYDGDGDVDVYMTSQSGTNWLYSNDGDGTFTNVTNTAGVAAGSHTSTGTVFIDYDNDGDQDLFVGGHGGNIFYENNGNGTFTDVTATTGLADGGRTMTAGWADFNEDGYLDVYLAKHKFCSGDDRQEDKLFVNDGDGTFTDVTTAYLCNGVAQCDDVMGLGFVPGWLDYDNDGDLDIFLVNDDISGGYQPTKLWRNDGSNGSGGWNFTEVSVAAGASYSLNGMGLGLGDYNNDGSLDLAFSHMGPAVLLSNDGDATFTDQSNATIVAAATSSGVTWGTAFFDHDNDGDLDLYFNNGSLGGGGFPNIFLDNNGAGAFTDQSTATGLDDGGKARALAIADFNADGFIDVLVVNYGEAPALLENQGNSNNWLSVTVEGTESNRDAIGTRLTLTAGGVSQIREITSGQSHGGGDQRLALFGLGGNASGTLVIDWPNGVTQNLGTVNAGQQLHFVEPAAPVIEPDIDAPVSVSFGDVETGTQRDKLVTVSNVGTGDLTITSLTTTDGQFTVVGPTTPVVVAAGGSVNVTVGLTPATDGLKTADLTVVSDDPDEGTITVALSGTGVTAASTTFVNVIADAGIDATHTLSSICTPPIGAGSAWADYDNDGDIDVYITDHGAANNLYRNDGDTDSNGVPNFTDVAATYGLQDAAGVGHATVFIDYDNDGDQDLYVSNWGSSHLYQNQLIETGSVAFTDVTATAGLLDDGRTVTAAWADYDNDGNLDVYLAKHAYCGGSDPRNGDKLYRGNGDGTFTDVTGYLCTSCDPIDSALGFSAGWFDYDNDGDQDLYLVNDVLQGNGSGGSQNYHNVLWRNDGANGSGGWNFTDVSTSAGVDKAVNGMGLGIGDYNNDGFFDIAFSDIGASTLYSNDGDGTFTDVSNASNAGTGSLTWGTAFFDYNNDGWVDLFYTSGLVGAGGSTPDIFLENNANGTFTDISVNSGLNNDGRGRHAAMVDFDQDGLVDLFVGNYGTPQALYQNRADVQGNTNNWLFVTVEGTESNRDGIGTRLTLTAGGITQIREINSGPTHGGGDYRAAYFGLGTASSGTLVIDWPNGESETINISSGDIDQYMHRVEPSSVVTPPATTFVEVTGLVGMNVPHTLSATVCAGPPLGTGTAWADYDNDSDIDVFVVNQGAANWLYRNDGDTSSDGLPDYTNVAAAAGVDDPNGVTHSAVFIDYDNDGDQDLYVTNWDDGTAVHGNVLYENHLIESGSATFTDVTATAGLADNGRAITSGWADFDQDGYLDVYLAKHTACGSNPVEFLQDHLYHNNGDGTFTDVSQYLCTSTGGVLPCPSDIEGRGFMPGWFDFDNDGDQDLYLVNDWNASTNTNRLWRNDGADGSGGWIFVEVSATAGVSPAEVNGMGLAIGDPNNDGWLDLSFSDVGLAWLYLNDQDGTFTDVSSSAGLPAGVTWGTAFFDYDNDGWEDLFLAGGSIHDPINNPADTMLRNRGGQGFVGSFEDVSAATGLNHTGRGRAVSTVDFDQDGYVDLMVGNYGQDYRFYRNYISDEGNTNHWLTVTVEGTTGNRDAIGARVILTTNDGTQIREINSGWNHGGGSYRAAYFGLGTETSGTLSVRWPDGTTQVIGSVFADQAIHLVEPLSVP